MIAKSLRRFGWRRSDALLASAMVALGLCGTWSVWVQIASYVQYTDQRHILLVPLVAAYLLYVRRGRFARCPRVSTWAGPMIVVGGWLLMLLGPRWSIQAFVHLGALLVVIGCLISVVGTRVVARFFPAFAVLVFVVPVPGIVRYAFADPIRDWGVTGGEFVFRLMGMAVDRAHDTVTISGHVVPISELSGGMIMAFTMMLVSYAFAFGMPLRNWVRFVIIAASPLAAVALNAVRLIPTVWLYGYAGPQTASIFHLFMGWLVVALSFMTLFTVIRFLRRAMVPVTNFTLAMD